MNNNNKLRRPCRDCDEKFVPTSRTTKLCPDCRYKNRHEWRKSTKKKKPMKKIKQTKRMILGREGLEALYDNIYICKQCKLEYGSSLKGDDGICPICSPKIRNSRFVRVMREDTESYEEDPSDWLKIDSRGTK